MTDTPKSTTDDAATWPDCPACGQPMASVTVEGPSDGTAHPCGCHLQPSALGDLSLE